MDTALLCWTAIGLALVTIVLKLYYHLTIWSRQGISGFRYIHFAWAFEPSHVTSKRNAERFGRIYGGFRIASTILWLNDERLVRDLSLKDVPIRNSFYAGSTNINRSLFFMEANDDWKRIRSIVTPAFTAGKLRAMLSPIERIADTFVQNLRSHARAGDTFDLKQYIGGFAMDVIASCGYGVELDSVRTPNHPMVVNAKKILNVDISASLIVCIFFPRIAKFLGLEAFDKRAVNYFDDLTFKIIEQRTKNQATDAKQYPDLLGLMIESAQKDDGTEVEGRKVGITRDEISGQGILFFIAGFDTTHATFDHAIYYLTQYPEWQDRLYAELAANRTEFDYEKLKELPILNAIIAETLRIRPPLNEFQRESKHEFVLSDTGIRVPADTLIIVEPCVMHHDPQYFPEPQRFRPERFLHEDGYQNKAYMPFGIGQRLCVGMRFAQNELRIGLAKFVLNFRVEAEPDYELEYFNGSILRSPKKLMVKIAER